VPLHSQPFPKRQMCEGLLACKSPHAFSRLFGPFEGPLSTLPRTHETSAGPCNGMRTTLNLLQCSRFRVPQRAAESPPALRLALHLHQPPRFPGPQERRHSSCSAALRATCMPLACVFRIC
jgi:hypothetical protein